MCLRSDSPYKSLFLLESILIFSQTKSVISAYEFDFMKVLEGREFNSSSTSISLGNIFELAGVTTSAEN